MPVDPMTDAMCNLVLSAGAAAALLEDDARIHNQMDGTRAMVAKEIRDAIAAAKRALLEPPQEVTP